jgi:hypothetical protein
MLRRPRLSGIIADTHRREATPKNRTPIIDPGKTLPVPAPTGPRAIPTNLAAIIIIDTTPELGGVTCSYPTK